MDCAYQAIKYYVGGEFMVLRKRVSFVPNYWVLQKIAIELHVLTPSRKIACS